MTELAHSPWQGRGMLLLQGEPDPVASWAQRGLMPVHVVPLQGWTAVLPAGPSHALPPYDDTLKTLAGRPVIAPSSLQTADAPILVSSMVSQSGIVDAAREWFGPDVPLILLY